MGYVNALIADLETDLMEFTAGTVISIFIGGGTPSLFSANAYTQLFAALKKLLRFDENIEITLEANPGTVDQVRFSEYRALGINRLSLGIQSFNPTHLKSLGRIHNDKEAHYAIERARKAGFDNLNLDIMHGLPNQTLNEGLQDLEKAIAHQPEHLSWYQLTIEPNTIFYKTKPTLPEEDLTYTLEQRGLEQLKAHGFHRYEISAFTRGNHPSIHNLNYWRFGDYLGIGAGAHGKLTYNNQSSIYRTRKHRQPTDYLNPSRLFLAEKTKVDKASLIFEFMLNTTRLEEPIPYQLFSQRTGLDFEVIKPLLKLAETKGFLKCINTHWQITPFGRRYTNNLQALFLP
jgi:putative oxygen-independent coproporphyrinogen III oxidase